MTNLPATVNSAIPDTHELQVYQLMAKKAADSRLFQSLGGEPGIVSIMLYARELGLPPMQAISGGLNIVKGKVELSARTINSMIRQAGHSIKILEHTDEVCRIVGKRKDTGEEYEASFSIADAKRAGIYANTWERYPRDMCFNRAVSRLGRILFPDVIGNSYTEGEIREAVDVEFSSVNTAPAITEETERPPVPKVNREEKPKPKAKKPEPVVVDIVPEEVPAEPIEKPKPTKSTKPTNTTDVLKRYFGWLDGLKTAQGGKEYAESLICKAFDVDQLKDIPENIGESVYDYCRDAVTEELRQENWIPVQGVSHD